MPTAFVLSGGASIAAVQVGMMTALHERGVRPDLLVGTSAGAINAAYVAGHGDGPAALDGLARIWSGLRRRDVFPVGPARGVLAGLGVRPSLCSPDRLAVLLRAHLPFSRLEDARIPVHLVATDVLTGQELLLSEGPALSALLASCAIPGVFPPVEREDRILCDGALADNAAISQAVALGADRVYVLPSGTTCDLDRPPATALGVALHALTLLLEQRLILETAAYAGTAELRVIPPLCPLAVPGTDFSRARELIDRAHRTAGEWLDSGAVNRPHPERFLALHGHTQPPRRQTQPARPPSRPALDRISR
ncbi:MAG: patatin-like phospholipase family protein [Actinomycetes bacterium]